MAGLMAVAAGSHFMVRTLSDKQIRKYGGEIEESTK